MKGLFARIADYIRETDKVMLFLAIFTASYGCMAVFSATYYTENHSQFFTQFFSMLIGLGGAIFISFFDHNTILKKWWLAAFVGVIPVILTFFIGFAPDGTDDKAWLMVPGIGTFQPSEFLKICFVVTFSAHLSAVKSNINKLKFLIPVVLHGAFPVALIHFQGDDGTALVFAVMFISMLFSAGLNLKYFIAAGLSAIVALPLVYFFVMSEDQQKRIFTVFNLEADLQGAGYQQWMARIALANGGVVGQGYLKGELTQSAVVPEGYNDFIFVSIGEELGLLGCLVVVILLAAICARCIWVGKASSSDSGMFIAVGIFAMLLAQTVINLGMCLSILPVIGVTLPFFSAGGTSLTCLMLGIGLMLSVYMHRHTLTVHI